MKIEFDLVNVPELLVGQMETAISKYIFLNRNRTEGPRVLYVHSYVNAHSLVFYSTSFFALGNNFRNCSSTE